jgi:hypothetical protein
MPYLTVATVPRLIGSVVCALLGFVTALAAETAQSQRNPPTLAETLQWLSGASEAESGNGDTLTNFEIGQTSCSAIITETRTEVSPGFWIKMSFSLADIDPDDIHVEDLGKGPFPFPGKFAVRFHTTNYAKKISYTSWKVSEPFPVSEYTVSTNDLFGPKFARALKHAVRLCGGKRSAF